MSSRDRAIGCVDGEVGSHRALERQLAEYTRQHEVVARLGQHALGEQNLKSLMDEVVRAVADALEVELCAVLALREDGEMLDIIADEGHGPGPTVLPAGAGTQAGYAIETRRPVVSLDLNAEMRFDASSLRAQGMVSGMNSIIEGHERPFGVLAAHSAWHRLFSEGDVNFLVAVANLLSAAIERDRRDQLARYAALHDSLTGLPNRTLAVDRLDRALARRGRDKADVALLVLDLDRFKVINDSLGHGAGDEVLRTLATRLQENLRPADTVARIGGDEFAIVCESRGGPRHFVELAQRVSASVGEPFSLSSGEHFLTGSVGVAVAAGQGDTPASLLRDAGVAMHRAKQRGRGRYELFDASLRAQVTGALRTEQELRQALNDGQLQVHYQPIVDMTGRPVATEALVRWIHPRRGLIPPLDFIPIAEETGMITELGRHVLDVACEQGAAWQRRFGVPLQMLVNVSGSQIENPRFAAEAAETADRHQLLGGTLGLEVTESVLIQEIDSSLTVLRDFRKHGIRLLLDDFGTGYSSLSYLRRLPLDGVKVDRSFIDGLDRCPENIAILRAIIEMCHALGLPVVGEGVESAAQLQQLRRLGCESAQGFLVCHPRAAEDISAFLQARLGVVDVPTVAGPVGSPA